MKHWIFGYFGGRKSEHAIIGGDFEDDIRCSDHLLKRLHNLEQLIWYVVLAKRFTISTSEQFPELTAAGLLAYVLDLLRITSQLTILTTDTRRDLCCLQGLNSVQSLSSYTLTIRIIRMFLYGFIKKGDSIGSLKHHFPYTPRAITVLLEDHINFELYAAQHPSAT